MGKPVSGSAGKARSGNHCEGASVAVLISGGLDSAVLLGESLRKGATVQPLYVRTGLYWEAVELQHLQRFLGAVRTARLRALHILDFPVADLYDAHWSMTGRNVPDAASADEAVFLPGRNVLLLAKGLLWCHLHGVAELALGLLKSNPFRDATPAFFAAYEGAVNMGLGDRIGVCRPFAQLTKPEVMRRGQGLPLELTFSCIRPIGGRHCGRCNKCAERRHAFAGAGMVDATPYDAEVPCTG